jgi:hypothetical protein
MVNNAMPIGVYLCGELSNWNDGTRMLQASEKFGADREFEGEPGDLSRDEYRARRKIISHVI